MISTLDVKRKQQKKMIEQKFIPDRVCGDIPFHHYRSIFAKSSNYIEFIKQLEQSTSRHDFIFWFFDIIAGGREEHIHGISVKEIDNEVKNAYRNVSEILKHASENKSMSDYIITEYPMIFKIPFEKICHNPILFTVRNNDEIFRYRQNALNNIRIKILENMNDEFIHLNPMKGLSPYDLPEAPTELGYEKPDERKSETQPFFSLYHRFIAPTELGYEKPDERKLEIQPFFSLYHHFVGLLTYSKRIPDTTDCILVDKDPYKRLQIETYMKDINIDKLVKVDADKVQELGLNESTVVIVGGPKFHDDDGQQSFYKPKRVRVLSNVLQQSSTEILVLFVDYGEI
uniref:Uncharacterized protein n=1 Tax=Panagrolaimus sp. PS1159 TaxID=55785 RepID=A0AC35GEY0_9BILA